MAYSVELLDITKRFPGVLANDGVTVRFEEGGIHAVIGENGAGKSTLMSILYGLHQPDAGQIIVRGEHVTIPDPSAAIALRLGMVHQHFMLVPSLTVAENVILGNTPTKRGLTDIKVAERRLEELSEQYGMAVRPRARVRDLSVGVLQRVEILKALYRGADVLILDEPTAVLTPQESFALFDTLRALAAQGKTIVFISHKLKEVLAVSQRVTVMRQGKVTGELPTDGRHRAGAGAADGRPRGHPEASTRPTRSPAHAVLELAGRQRRGRPPPAGAAGRRPPGQGRHRDGHRGRGGQRPDGAHRGHHRPPSRDRRPHHARAARTSPAAPRASCARRAWPTSPRTAWSAACPRRRPSRRTSSSTRSTSRRCPGAAGWTARRSGATRTSSSATTRSPRRTRRRAPGRCRAATCRRSWSRARSRAGRRCSSPRSPRAAWTWVPSSTSTGASWSCATRAAPCCSISAELDEILSLSDEVAVLYEGRIVSVQPRAEVDELELGLRMAGVHDGHGDEHHDDPGAAA